MLLIVEDRLLGDDLAATLGELGYGVDLSSVAAALAPGFSATPDLIVVDIAGVAEVDAAGTGERIRRRWERPIIHLVDDDDQASQIEQQGAGAIIVMWPFPPAALDEALQQALVAVPRRV